MTARAVVGLLLGVWLLAGAVRADAPPALPEGLGEPAAGVKLPEGLGDVPLPEGLGEEPSKPAAPAPAKPSLPDLPEGLSGFVEARGGLRTQADPHEKRLSIAETRLHLEYERPLSVFAAKVAGDLLFDPVADDYDVRLEEGRGVFDLREAHLGFSPAKFMDVKVGRQILTWGVGDLLFINDLFPKAWNSFFIGRDENYLKAPSDAAKAAFFTEIANLDVVFTPRFDADRFIDGQRISFWNDAFGRRTGRDALVRSDPPDRWFEDNEVAVRLHRVVRGYELALYGYRGYWKSPGGMDPVTGEAVFPKLSVYGASARGPLGPGIGSVEFGYYDSRDDRRGDDPFIRNSELRFLAGYEQEVAKDFTAGAQYYLEHMLDYSEYRRTLPATARSREEDRHVLTVRLTKRLLNQNLTLGVFGFYCPSDQDAFLRPRVHYKISDHWSAEVGGNVFFGEQEHTFFGQFARNSNVYAGLRFSF